MKKFFIYVTVILLLMILVGGYVAYQSITTVTLPHGGVLHVLPASKDDSTKISVVLCPGGGYRSLEIWREGYMWFPYFFCQGITAAVLEYRLPNGNSEVPITDGSEAIQLMRKWTSASGANLGKVGMMGFSAGGHIVSSLMVSDRLTDRPDYAILFYPIISMRKGLTHQGAHDHLLGQNVSERIEAKYSNELHVSENTPPAYIVVCLDDRIVNPQNAQCFYQAMKRNNVPVVMQEYPSGGHGWGYRLTFDHHKQMVDDLTEWLQTLKK